MMISTKGRYALRVMIDIAEHQHDGYIPLKEIAARQEISEKYLESIVSVLSKMGFVDAMRGKGGGYRLSRKPEAYCVGEILRAVEESIEPVTCIVQGAPICETADSCQVLPIWKGLSGVINAYLDGITLAEVANWKGEPET